MDSFSLKGKLCYYFKPDLTLIIVSILTVSRADISPTTFVGSQPKYLPLGHAGAASLCFHRVNRWSRSSP